MIYAMSEQAQAAQQRHWRRGLMSTSRVEAFSDGVFAIAITLLILEIRLPGSTAGLTDARLRAELLGLWPSYLAYAISFLLIGMVWINHHRMFRYIERVDGVLLGLNVLLLMDVAFLPFSTDVLAQSLRGTSAEHTAAAFYGLVLAVGGVFYNALWLYASYGHRLLGEHITPREARALGLRWSLGPLFYLVAAGVGLINAVASLGCYVLLLVFYFFDLRPRRP